MQVQVEASRALVLDDGTPVRGASALARLGAGWLVAQDGSADAAWVLPGATRRLAVSPGGGALDLQAACSLVGEGGTGVLLLGSGATAGSRTGVLVTEREGADPAVEAGDLGGLYAAVAAALEVPADRLDVEGVARNGPVLRWFTRGVPGGGVPSASVDVGLPSLLEALRGRRDPAQVPLRAPRRYDLGDTGAGPLAATDAVALPGGRLLLSAATGDGSAAALALVDDDRVVDVAVLPPVDGVVARVQGLGVLELLDGGARLLAVADGASGSVELAVRVHWD